MEFERIGIVGAGLMGSGIAQVAAYRGLQVTLVDVDDARVSAGIAGVRKRLASEAAKGRITQAGADAASARITGSSDWETLSAVRAVDAVIEAIVEDPTIKGAVFRRLGAVTTPGTLLATNTSSLPVSEMAAASGRPERVVGLHFFNPPWVLKLLEIVSTESTSPETMDDALALAAKLGRAPVRVSDTPGFLVNRLLVPFIFDAIRLLESGVATAEHVDQGCKLGLNHAMGPLATADLVGFDTLLHIADSMFDEFGEARFKAPTLLRRLVSLGHLGRKTGRGFFNYE